MAALTPSGGGADVLDSDEDVSSDETRDDVMSSDEAGELSRQALVLEEDSAIRGLLKEIAKLGADSKARALEKLLLQAREAGYESAIVFTQYQDTLDYLKDYLAERFEVPVGCFSGLGGQRRDHSGSWVSCSKEQIKRSFREGAIGILVCTDAAGEGLNLQTCGALINYDLPWNPMKVEQRIGRIDRIGQTHGTVRIVNLGYTNTVETDVYFALRERIGMFTGVVGKLQPILSRLPQQFAEVALAKSGDRARARQDALIEVERLVTAAEASGFDIDEVSESDFIPPAFSHSPLHPADLDLVLRRTDLLPPGVTCQELEPTTYALQLPGEKDAARITTRPDVFEYHFENHQLSPQDSPLFQRLSALIGEPAAAAGGAGSSIQEIVSKGR